MLSEFLSENFYDTGKIVLFENKLHNMKDKLAIIDEKEKKYEQQVVHARTDVQTHGDHDSEYNHH